MDCCANKKHKVGRYPDAYGDDDSLESGSEWVASAFQEQHTNVYARQRT